MTKREYDKAYRLANKEKLRAYLEDYRQKNKERLRAQSRDHYERNASKIAAASREYRQANRDALSSRRKVRWERDKESINAKRREYKAQAGVRAKLSHQRLAKLYGLTPDLYQDILDAQGGGCAICTKSPRMDRMVVDHCHRTNIVRGILCHRCNAALGLMDDSPEKLRWAAEYLENFNDDISSLSSGAISMMSRPLSNAPSTRSGSPTPPSTAPFR